MNPGLIVFGEDWGRHPSSTQHLVRELAKDRDVIWVNSIGLRRPRFTLSDASRVAVKFGRMLGGKVKREIVSKPERMTIVEPTVIPLPGNPVAASINRRVLGRKLQSVMKQRNMTEPVLWTSLPTAVDLLGLCGEKAIVYYCGDEFGALAGVDHRPVLKCERKLADRADLILAASGILADKFGSPKTRLLPHGVDINLFSTPAERADDLPEADKIAGFYGSLSEWLDQELIAACANKFPNWSFVFIGEERTDVSQLRSLPNVHLLGPRSHDQLPRYVQHWNVSMMPFKDNEQIRACNPLKLREYLAAGRPVVATPFPALKAYGDLITLGSTADEFVRAIESASREHPSIAQLRKLSVQTESWSARAQNVSSHLSAL